MPWAGAYHRRNAPLYAFETCRACHTLRRKSSDEPSPLYYVGYRVPFHTPNADDQPVTSVAHLSRPVLFPYKSKGYYLSMG